MLPYLSISEAEFSLGRNLTFAETLWYNYSAKKSDYFLYLHNTIFFLMVYTLVPLPWVIMEVIRSKKTEQYKLQPNFRNSLSDMFDCYKKVLNVFLMAIVALEMLSFPLVKWAGIRTSLPLPSLSEMVIQIVVYFLIEDYVNYWVHRLLHGKWGYENIHRVHHEFTAPIGFVAPYAHWSEIIILGQASVIGPLIVPGHMITFWVWLMIRQIEAIETHSGYEFPWSPSKLIPFYGGAEYHDYHHLVGNKCQSNFASVFTYCDYIYGTDKGYRYRKEIFEKMKEKSKIEREAEDESRGSLKSE